MSEQVIQVSIATESWLKRKVIYFPRELRSFFPSDALGARDEEALAIYPSRGVDVTFDYGLMQSSCDIATDSAGKMRARESGPVGKFYETNGAKVGDFVMVQKVSSHHFLVKLVKANGSAV